MLEPFGQRIGIRTNQRGFLNEIREQIVPTGWEVDRGDGEVNFLISVRKSKASKRKGSRNFHLLYNGSERRIRTESDEDFLKAIQDEIHDCCVCHAKERIMLHGSLIRRGKELRALLTFGESSEISLDSLANGDWEVLSKRFVCLGFDQKVYPYPGTLADEPLGELSVVSLVSQNQLAKSESPIFQGAAAVGQLVGQTADGALRPEHSTELFVKLVGRGLTVLNHTKLTWDDRVRKLMDYPSSPEQ